MLFKTLNPTTKVGAVTNKTTSTTVAKPRQVRQNQSKSKSKSKSKRLRPLYVANREDLAASLPEEKLKGLIPLSTNEEWNKDSWRNKPVLQQPDYPCEEDVSEVTTRDKRKTHTRAHMHMHARSVFSSTFSLSLSLSFSHY